MNDSVTWAMRLSHIRFSRVVLFAEKWLSLILLVALLVLGFGNAIFTCFAILIFLLFALVHANHYNLEETGGMPINRITLKF